MEAFTQSSEVGWAPGRIRLFGGPDAGPRAHVLDIAVGSGVRVRAERAEIVENTRALITSSLLPGECWLTDHRGPLSPPWHSLGAVARVLDVMSETGHCPDGVRLHVDSDVPAGIGLGFGAALTVATAAALAGLLRVPPTADELWGWIERSGPGRQSGRDAYASGFGRRDQAIRHRARTGAASTTDAQQPDLVPFDLDREGHVLLIVDLSPLMPVGEGPGREPVDEFDVAGENERVEAAVSALAAGELVAFGALLTEAHQAHVLRGAVAAPAQLSVSVLNEFGALGSRELGRGMSVLAVIHDDHVDNACIELRRACAARSLPYPDFRIEVTADASLGTAPGLTT